MINIQVTGNLGRAVENRVTKSGKNVASLSLGSTPRIKIDGEWQDAETIWFTITVWDHLPEMVFDKGATVMVSGSLKQSSYEKDGEKKTRLEITAESIGLIHRTKREPAAAQPDAWGSAPASASVVVDDTPF